MLELMGFRRQTNFPQDVFFIGWDIFPQVMIICLHLMKNVWSGLNIYESHF